MLIVGNWKMNLKHSDTVRFLKELSVAVAKMKPKHTEVVVAPPATSLPGANWALQKSTIKTSAQNMYFEEKGAFTGEISPSMVAEFAKYVIIGHSERRHIFGEKDKDIRRKVAAAVAHKLIPILCVGETFIEREEGAATTVVSAQVEAGLADLTAPEVSKIVVAYEPVWAIGTGRACEPIEANRMISHIRSVIGGIYGKKTALAVSILYGGSVDGKNIAGYLAQKEVGGALVGGASLHLSEFTKIIQAAEKPGKKR